MFLAVEEGDIDAAAAATRDHIENTRAQLKPIVFEGYRLAAADRPGEAPKVP